MEKIANPRRIIRSVFIISTGTGFFWLRPGNEEFQSIQSAADVEITAEDPRKLLLLCWYLSYIYCAGRSNAAAGWVPALDRALKSLASQPDLAAGDSELVEYFQFAPKLRAA